MTTRLVNSEQWAQSIDLHHERRQERRAALSRARRDAACLGILLLLVAVFFVPTTVQTLAVRGQLDRAFRDGAAAQQRLQSLTQRVTGLDQRLARWSRYGQSLARRRAWAASVRSLSPITPGTIAYDRLRMEQRDGHVEVALSGEAESMSALRGFVRNLGQYPLFTAISLNETAADSFANGKGVRFRMTARLKIADTTPARAGAR